MTTYSKYNIIYRLQKWMDSVPGQTFLNYAYSWGASVVILGTLFKLTHLPGANIMLFIGMGTEVVVFFLSAFDRPFDKTAIGMDLATHYTEEEEEAAEGQQPVEGVKATGQPQAVAAQGGSEVPAWVTKQEKMTPEMEEATTNYVNELKKLTDLLEQVAEQSQRLTRDSEGMENLNRTLTGICKIYEMQLKSASAQMGTIDQINEQTRHMAEQIAELNGIYARMIDAMTVNMKDRM